MSIVAGDFNVRVKILNFDGLVVNLHKARSDTRRTIKRIVGESAARMHQRTVDLCPKDTFYMSEHVRTDFTPSGLAYEVGWDAKDFLGTTDAAGRPRAFYPFFVEFGTVKMAAQPSLSIAFAEETPRFKERLSDALSEAYARTQMGI